MRCVLDLARRGIVSGGAERNRAFFDDGIDWQGSPPEELRQVLFYSETSGGLLVALAPEKAGELVRRLTERSHAHARRVGEVVARGGRSLFEVTCTVTGSG